MYAAQKEADEGSGHSDLRSMGDQEADAEIGIVGFGVLPDE